MLSPQRAPAPVQAHAGETLALAGIGKRFGDRAALQDLSLRLHDGELVAVTGPSGAGKSTLARIVSGLTAPDAGSLHLGGQDVRGWPPQARRVAHMFESFALYPTRTVRENIASPLAAPGNRGRWPADEAARRIDEVLALTEMTPLQGRLPAQLSGGQKQRVALCRALVQDPSVYVLDEPIGHLDAKLRHRLRGDIRRRQRALRPGTLWLTPDGLEAMAVADRLVVLIDGRVQQVGPPDEVFARPANVQVARLIGDPAMNVLNLGWLGDGRVAIDDAPAAVASDTLTARLGPHALGGRAVVGLRPRALQVRPADDGRAPLSPGCTDALAGQIYAVEPLGKSTIVSVDVGGQRLRAKLDGAPAWQPGLPVQVGFDAAGALAFDPDSGQLCS